MAIRGGMASILSLTAQQRAHRAALIGTAERAGAEPAEGQLSPHNHTESTQALDRVQRFGLAVVADFTD
jgi:hypothetical protein